MPKDIEKLPKKLRENLEPGENVLFYTKKMPSLEKPKWLVVTDRRIVYFDEKILGRYDMMSIPYEKVEKVYFVKGIASTDFRIELETGEIVKIGWMKKDQGVKVMEAIKQAISNIAIEPPTLTKKKSLTKEEMILVKPKESVVRGVTATPRQAMITGGEKRDPYEELLKLKKLLDEGVISQEEYNRLREKLLKDMGLEDGSK